MTTIRKYPVRGYWHSNGAEFEHPDGLGLTGMHRDELLLILQQNKYGYSYYDQDTYKKSYTLLKVGNYKDE